MTVFRALLLAAITMPASAAMGQDTNGQAPAPASVTKPSQPVNIGVEVSGTYNDNIYATRNRTQDDFQLLIKPFLRVDLGSAGTSATLRAEGELGRYAELTSENYNDWLLAADGRVQVTPGLSLIGGSEWRWDHESRASPDAVSGLEPTRYQRGYGYLGLVGKKGDVSGRLALTLTRYAFSNVAGADGTINNHDRDRLQGEVGTRLGYALKSGTELFVQGTYDWRDYDDAFDDFGFARNSHGISVAAGLRGKIGKNFSGEVFAGWLRQDYRDPRLNDINTFDMGATLNWKGDKGLGASFRLDRSVDETTLPGASAYIVTSARLGLDTDVNSRLSAGFGISGTQYDYVGSPRSEFVMGGDVWAKFWLNRNIYVGTDFTHGERSSNAAGYDYHQNRFEFTIGTQLRPGLASNAPALRLGADAPGGAYIGAMFGYGTLVTGLDGPRGEHGTNTADFGDHGSAAIAVAGFGVLAGSIYLGAEVEGALDGPRWQHAGDRTFSIEKRNAFGVAARVGWASERHELVYARFGWASAEFQTDYAVEDQIYSGRKRRSGLTSGLGIEVPVGAHGFMRTEYVVSSYGSYDVPTTVGSFDNMSSNDSQFRLGGGIRFGGASRDGIELPPVKFGGPYIGLQIGHGSLVTANQGPRTGGGGFTLDVTRANHGGLAGLYGGFGCMIGPAYFGLEAEGDVTAIDWNIERDPNGRIYSARHKWSYGGSARVGLAVSRSTLVYGRIGKVWTKFDVPYATSGTSVRSLEVIDGVRFGGGLEIGLGARARLRADYTVTNYSPYSIEYGKNSDSFDHFESLFRLGLSWRL